MRKIVRIALLLIFLMLNSCAANFIPITGVWICEELEMVLDFDDEREEIGQARGTIVIDGELHGIVCLVNPIASASIYYPKDENEYYSFGKELMLGKFTMRGKNKNKMIFRLLKDGKEVAEYIFIRQE